MLVHIWLPTVLGAQRLLPYLYIHSWSYLRTCMWKKRNIWWVGEPQSSAPPGSICICISICDHICFCICMYILIFVHVFIPVKEEEHSVGGRTTVHGGHRLYPPRLPQGSWTSHPYLAQPCCAIFLCCISGLWNTDDQCRNLWINNSNHQIGWGFN